MLILKPLRNLRKNFSLKTYWPLQCRKVGVSHFYLFVGVTFHLFQRIWSQCKILDTEQGTGNFFNLENANLQNMDLKGQNEEVKKCMFLDLHVPLGGLEGFLGAKSPS